MTKTYVRAYAVQKPPGARFAGEVATEGEAGNATLAAYWRSSVSAHTLLVISGEQRREKKLRVLRTKRQSVSVVGTQTEEPQ